MNKVQLGWYIVKQDTVYYTTPALTSSTERILVKAGKYPVYVRGIRILRSDNPRFNNMLDVYCNSAIITLDGISLDSLKPARKFRNPYLFELAESVLSDSGEYELFSAYEARETSFIYDGVPYITHGIYRKG